MGKLIFEKESYLIRGASFEVYREMGVSFVKPVYQEAMEKELCLRRVPFITQSELTLFYKGMRLAQVYKPDFICYSQIILELKAVKVLLDEHRAQIMNYLKASKLPLGFLINFGHYPDVQVERFVL